ncbi:hypothetical protein JCM6882_003882 [Rhodosporidiobolus microsporus]
MPSTTRASAASGLDFPSTKSTKSSTKSKSKAVAKPAASSLTEMTALFRSQIRELVAAPPPVPSHIKLASTDSIQILSQWERVSSRGVQQSVVMSQVARKGHPDEVGEMWITRTEGDKTFFPRTERVKKRLRSVQESDEEDAAMIDDVEEATPAKSSRKTTSSSKKRSTAPDAPRKARKTDPLASSSSSHRRRRDADHSDDDADADDGATTETEASHLARRHGRARDAAPLASSSSSSSAPRKSTSSSSRHHRTDAGPSASNTRRATRASTAASSGFGGDLFSVKQEEHDESGYATSATGVSAGGDDLASLCGRVEGMGVRSTMEPETDLEADLPSFSSSAAYAFPALSESSASDAGARDRKGKGRA